MFLLLNALLMYYTWKHLHDFPRDRLYRWYGSTLTALIVDFAMVETMDVWWSNYVVPSQCKEVWRQGVQTVLAIIDQFQIPIERDTSHFDMTKYLYVSKQVAKLFPTLLESQIILKYMSEMPDRVLTGPWRDNLDIVYARDGFINSWKASTRKYWKEGGYRRDVKETIKWVASLPTVVQRLLVGGWVVASMFALWYFLRGWIEWSGIWWFGGTVGICFVALKLIQWMYMNVPQFRYRVDEFCNRNHATKKLFGKQSSMTGFAIGEIVALEVEEIDRLYANVATPIKTANNVVSQPSSPKPEHDESFNLVDIYPQIGRQENVEQIFNMQQFLYEHAQKHKNAFLKQWNTSDFDLSSHSEEEGKQQNGLFDLSNSSVSSSESESSEKL
jgi:hypothetical protein